MEMLLEMLLIVLVLTLVDCGNDDGVFNAGGVNASGGFNDVLESKCK